MSWRTSRSILLARSVGRKLGINKRIAALVNGVGYEARYDRAFLSALKPGDSVWDVGANVGYYTRQFAEKVGAGGMVFGFEPSPSNFEKLKTATGTMPNVTVVNYGLGSETATLSLMQGADELGATSRIVEAGEGAINIDIRRGADLIETNQVAPPNAIKIDVEGFELEVLHGMGLTLGARSLRAVGIEVHFSLLTERGMENAPKQIEDLLLLHGFHVSWPDASHIVALRST